jgi:glycosyltransferase involved in cell wall biosynthesis
MMNMSSRPIVSILVHTRNSIRTIEEHLKSIKKQSYNSLDIIIVDNNSTDGTLEVARKYSKKVFTFGPERSAQRNFAAKEAKSDYLLIPDSDMILGEKVVEECVELLEKNPALKAIIIPERSIGKGFWAKCKQLERSYYSGIGWIEGARFFKKDIFEEMGGYDEDNTGTEDFDLPQKIVRKYGEKSIGRIKNQILHDEGNLRLMSVLKKKFYYGRSIHVYKEKNPLEYSAQSSLLRRYNLFFSKPEKLLKNPAVGLGMLFMKTLEFSAGGLGHVLSRREDGR